LVRIHSTNRFKFLDVEEEKIHMQGKRKWGGESRGGLGKKKKLVFFPDKASKIIKEKQTNKISKGGKGFSLVGNKKGLGNNY